MARTPITIRVTPEVFDRLAYLAMRPVVATEPGAALAMRRRVAGDHAADVLDRWGRRRGDDPHPTAVIEYMAAGRPAHAHEEAARTVELVCRVQSPTAAALATDPPGGMDADEFAALLVGRWSDWYAHLARLLPLIAMNGVPE